MPAALKAPEPSSFASAEMFRKWLEKNHATAVEGLWLRFFKKASGVKSLTYAEALDEALCFGWIDAQVKRLDDVSWMHRFMPRRAKSAWSLINTRHAERLLAAGAMRPSGLRAVEAARQDGRWAAAYASPRYAEPPEDFLRELRKNRKAQAFFKTLNRANVYAIVYRLQTAKRPETRARRLKIILEMMDEGKVFHP